MANQGNYDHPSYIVRQILHFPATTAGANGTSGLTALPWDIRVHNMSAVVVTAGTSATSGNKVFLLAGTASQAGSDISLGTSVANTVGTSGDINVKVTAGTVLSVKNGTDATGVARVTLEYNISPDTGTWLGTS